GGGTGGDAEAPGHSLYQPGGVRGAGLSLTNGATTITNSHIDNNAGAAGSGGLGGNGFNAGGGVVFTSRGGILPGPGGNGGNGGTGGDAAGGGVFFVNTTSNTLGFTFNGGSASNNKLTGGTGGAGGNAGSSGSKYVLGGIGGDGGNASGGGLYLLASTASLTTSISNASFSGNALSGGLGGAGG